MASWIDRFAKMSPEERAMTVAEDPSTLMALVNEAALMQDWYRRWCLARKADPETRESLTPPCARCASLEAALKALLDLCAWNLHTGHWESDERAQAVCEGASAALSAPGGTPDATR